VLFVLISPVAVERWQGRSKGAVRFRSSSRPLTKSDFEDTTMKTILAACSLLVLASAALAEMPLVEPIASVAPASSPSEQIRICTGAESGAYFSVASQMLGLVQAKAKMPVTVAPGGGRRTQ